MLVCACDPGLSIRKILEPQANERLCLTDKNKTKCTKKKMGLERGNRDTRTKRQPSKSEKVYIGAAGVS